MDLPLISNFVQSSVDAAMAEYVAPKSLTLDLKDMLVGDDFKKDTTTRGVIITTIKRAFDFKEGDAGVAMIKAGSADPYVSVGWAKFGKPVWSTRVILSEMEPHWEETAYILVTPEELNVDERLRVQLWDSDRTTADDDLGRIEVDVKELMRDPRSNGKMWDREDGLKALKAGEGMPGKLKWSVGYYSKQRITDDQLAAQEDDPGVTNIKQLKQKVYEESGRKLREASKDESDEIEQQKAQDLKVFTDCNILFALNRTLTCFQARQDELIISSPPAPDYPSGILSVQIHQITGLELEVINKNKASKMDSGTDEEEEGDDLPSAYCTIILNHQKIFKTRTKPKNSKPFVRLLSVSSISSPIFSPHFSTDNSITVQRRLRAHGPRYPQLRSPHLRSRLPRP
jgi:Ca2+-dependent lipid-binding protein